MVIQRKCITVHGIVQGVGFRPFVHRLASRWNLAGLVRNRVGAVTIEVEGEDSALDQFLAELEHNLPPLAEIHSLHVESQPVQEAVGFVIEASDADAPGEVVVAPDMATCPACLRELFDQSNRRYRYPFLNCTDCGPRLTIITGAPYDRPKTTMASFAMCADCQAEYDSPADRRFHAQPNACPVCGPRLVAHDAAGVTIATDDPLAVFVQHILTGKIGALKGLGGYHLVCDAGDENAVVELRRRKQRDEKPFAVMVTNLKSAERLCEISPEEARLLQSPRRPIVLLRRRENCREALAPAIAPGNPYLGIMLPYTPLHHLLLHDVGDIPLVMTSGNRSDEPIAYQNDDARQRLGDIADVFLSHDRPIHVRCDDSVTRIVGGDELPVRRSRGYAPVPIQLPVAAAEPMLAVGGQLKGVFGLAQSERALLSHHLGDLDHFDAFRAFERDVRLFEELFDISPRLIVHDAHPDYASTHYAQRRAAEEGLSLLSVQHHHAHMASCLAEHGLNERAIGVSLDGTGYGPDGAIWGGEFLVGDYAEFSRAAHLRYVRLPGGDKAVDEPWRMAAAYLADAGLADQFALPGVSDEERRIVGQMIERGFNSPWTSSTGRLFDAVAALIGLRQRVRHEGQAAMELEWLATETADPSVYPFTIESVQTEQTDQTTAVSPPSGWMPRPQEDMIDTRPVIRAIVSDIGQGAAADLIARRFHNTLIEIVAETCLRLRQASGLSTVVLSGGVFQNALLTCGVKDRLAEKDVRVFSHRLVPANDGGICLGQLAVAAAALKRSPQR